MAAYIPQLHNTFGFPRSQKLLTRWAMVPETGSGRRSRGDKRANGSKFSSILLWNHGLRQENLLSTPISPNSENKQGGINWILWQHPSTSSNELLKLAFGEVCATIRGASPDSVSSACLLCFREMYAKCIETGVLIYRGTFRFNSSWLCTFAYSRAVTW